MNETYVPGYGCSTAKLMVIGEAPGGHEVAKGYPFAGPTGDLLNGCFEFAGINRSEVYLTNVCKIQPPCNDIKKLHLVGHKLEEFLPQLYEEITQISPNCILALGNVALEALTGFSGIKHYRGSILRCPQGPKVVPTLHPASLLHQAGGAMLSWKELAYIRFDTKRANEEAQFKDYRPPSRNLHIANNSLDVIRYLERHQHLSKVTLDVETFKTWAMCTGLSFHESEALSIPLFVETIPLHDRTYIWKILAEFLADTRIKIIAQNAKFDQKRCRQLGLTWHKCWFSLDMGWHILFPEFPKKLEFIASILTKEPYYKDEGKEYNPKIHKIDRWLLYNAKDAAVEYECADKILEQLKLLNLEEFYWDRIQPLYDLYYDIEDCGILIDMEIRKHLHKKYTNMRAECHERLVQNISNGDKDVYEVYKNFNVMSNGPKNQVAKLIFGYLGLPVRADTGSDTLKALANNHCTKDERKKNIILGTLDERRIRKTIGTYIEADPVTCFTYLPGPRICTQANINGTETGRTSTGILKPPVSINHEGIALQTMTKHEDADLAAGGGDLRSMFVADPGWSLVEIDQAQAEDRVTCVLAQDWDALKQYEKKDFKYNKHGCKDDRHTLTTMAACGIAFEDVTDEKRQIGKMTRHAGNLAIGKHELMLHFGDHGLFLSEWKCGKFLEAFHAANPKIRSVFHEGIKEALRDNDCVLVTPHGRRRQFFNKWGDELFKEAYAYINQATVSDQTKFAMQALTSLKEYKKEFFFSLESHDSALGLVKDEFLDTYIKLLSIEFEKPINFRKCTLSRDYDLVIPCDVKGGKRWIDCSSEWPDGMKKWKGNK